jgi:capsular polysaccharide transport system permease protein
LFKRNHIQIFFAVQKALFLRELNMRLSQSRVGLFWTFFQPFFQVFIFIAIKAFIFGRTSDRYDFAVFLALSFTSFFMFRNIVNKTLGAFSANKSLFIHKQVKPIDTVVARVLLEMFITFIVVCIFITLGVYFNFDMNVQSLGIVAIVYLWLVVFAFAIGIFLAVLNSYTTMVATFVSFGMTILMFASALFYTVDSLSPNLQKILLLNPMVHFMEMLHGAYFYTLDDRYVDYMYMTLWTLIPLYAGLWFYVKLEQRIISL